MPTFSFYKGDTATLTASTSDGSPANSVTWTFHSPGGTLTTVGPNVISPSNSSASLNSALTTEIGTYTVSAQFTLVSGPLRTTVISYGVTDPVTSLNVDLEATLDLAWTMLEDCFDSDLGGPYLRGASLANFDRERMRSFVATSLFVINNQQPVQQLTDTTFPYSQARPLLAKALLLETIKHLMRSYVEQYQVVGGAAPVSYFERRDYLQRWQTIYTMEMEEWKLWLAMFKRQQYDFGTSKILVDSKAGRRMYYPGLRARYPRIGGFF